MKTLKLQEDAVKQSLDKTVNFIEVNGALKTVFDNIGVSEYLDINNSSNIYSNKSILESRQFENILLEYLGVATQLHKIEYPIFKDDIELLIRLIEDKIKNS